jgi:hypothetical protein
MIVTQLKGGLGNQMFQYAVARKLCLLHNTELKLDVRLLEPDHALPQNATYRAYELYIFNIAANKCTQEDYQKIDQWPGYPYTKNRSLKRLMGYLQKYASFYYIKEYSRINELSLTRGENINILKIPNNSYLCGYWANRHYFDDIENSLRKDFTFRQALPKDLDHWKKRIQNTHSVSINVRRGDYLTNQTANRLFGVCSRQYYLNAMARMKTLVKDPEFFVFSDDIEWCKTSFGRLSDKIHFIPNNHAQRKFEFDIHLISLCKHNIISNSTFTWWGAWLNQNTSKKVIYPLHWYKDVRQQQAFLKKKSFIYNYWIGLNSQ